MNHVQPMMFISDLGVPNRYMTQYQTSLRRECNMTHSLTTKAICLALLVIVAELVNAYSSSARPPTLSVRTFGPHLYAECIADRYPMIAGSRMILTARVGHKSFTSNRFNPTLEDPWTRLRIEIGTFESGEFIADDELLEALRLAPSIPWTDLYADSVFDATGDSTKFLLGGPRFDYEFTLPLEYAGYELHFRAIYEDPILGSIQSVPTLDSTRVLGRLYVALPCNEPERQQASGSIVWIENRAGNRERAIEAMDSLMAEGEYDLSALAAATQSASFLGRHRDALRYLDANYEHNKRIWSFPWVPTAEDLAIEEARYRELRQELVDKIEKQK